ncbi:hypothetical protein [Streptomyces sp. NBC_01465]|uniref:hypothetical protein n=1 Tax=Streptomyces sp. NBC_01465 TaxID=2903878 RepID=UPI002E3377F6|nr:hypothetical protein [Streptomyces sp. NBC_01465]
MGGARLRWALVVAALVATAFTWLSVLPAQAAPTPTPSPSSTAPATTPAAGAQRAPSAEEMAQIEEVLREQGERFSKAAQETLLQQRTDALRKRLPQEGGILSVFNVVDSGGMPISAYTVKSDTGGVLDWSKGVQNFLTELCFLITKWVIAFCCWLITWALSFGLAKLLMTPVLSVTGSLHARVILEMGLPGLFLSVCALVCVARIFFGDRTRGWGDAALSLLIAALTSTMLVSTPQTLMGDQDGALAMARGLALEVADVILDAHPNDTSTSRSSPTQVDPAALARPLTNALTDAFVVKPAMLLQYGQVFDGDCAKLYSDTKLSQLSYDRQVSGRMSVLKKLTGLADYITPSGTVSTWYDTQIDMSVQWAVDHFGNPPDDAFEAKCVPDAASAKEASLDKIGGALFLLLAALIVTVLIVALTGRFLIAQARIAWDAVRGEAALVAGTLPGFGRGILWDWCASVLRSLTEMIWSVVALAVFIVFIQAVLDPVQNQGTELTLRFLTVDFLCIGALIKRKKITTSSQRIAGNFRSKMSSGRIGGTHGSIFAPPASTPIAKKPHPARTVARGMVRGALVATSLAQGNPVAAAAYALPSSVGATMLMSRLGYGGRHRPRGRTTGPGRGPTQRPRPLPNPGQTPVPQPTPGGHGPGMVAGPGLQLIMAGPQQPSGPNVPQSNGPPARAPGVVGARAGQRHTPNHPVPTQPAASPRQQQLRQRLNRRPAGGRP